MHSPQSQATQWKEVRDPLGRSLRLPAKPRRLLSLVPSITELLFDLGLGERVVGRTRFCVRPEGQVDALPRIGGTKDLKLEQILALQPDLVLAHKEENTREQVQALSRQLPVWVCDVATVAGALEMIRSVGRLCGVSQAGEDLAEGIRRDLAGPPPCPPLRTAYLIWRKPWMASGGDTFIHSMLEAAGLRNLFADRARYPEVSLAELREAELVLLSSEPFPFKPKHLDELRPELPTTRLLPVDGQVFSWYGSRMAAAEETFCELAGKLEKMDHTAKGDSE